MQMTLFPPATNWKEPDGLPAIPAGIPIAVDLETKDDGLSKEMGAGWAWSGGYILGVAIAWGDHSCYLPIAHPDTRNLPADRVGPWLHEVMLGAKVVVFHNAPYDLGWLTTWNMDPNAYPIADTHAMAVMLDENRLSYSLDNLCKSRGLPHKDERLLREAALAFGLDPKNEMWKLPAKFVGPYAEQDTRSTLYLYHDLLKEEEFQAVQKAYQLEIDLIPCTIAMRKQGLLIDDRAAIRVQDQLRQRTEDLFALVRHQAPPQGAPKSGEDFRSARYLEVLFDSLGIPYGRTKKTQQGQFLSKELAKSSHPIPRAIAQWRQLTDLREKFIGTYILDNSHRGRIHAEIHQLRSDDSGTRSYRFSYSNPPLQQMPARDEDLAPLIRGIFLPEHGDLWMAGDFSAQEPRLTVHFADIAGLRGAAEAVQAYNTNPRTDFHQWVADLTGLPRSQAKIINLGLAYGMGVDKLAFSLGISIDEARGILAQYNERMPFIQELSNFCMRRAEARGFVVLLDGARCRWNLWQVGKQSPRPYSEALRLQENGVEGWQGTLRRAFAHKGMNRLIQGSAARQTKLVMRECWRQGLMPRLQMHDELDFSVQSKAQVTQIVDIMENTVPLRVPTVVDAEVGITWGDSMKKGQNSYEQAAARLKAA